MDKKNRINQNNQKMDKQSSILSFFSPKTNSKNDKEYLKTPSSNRNKGIIADELIKDDKNISNELLNMDNKELNDNILKELELFSAERDPTTCETTPCKNKLEIKSNSLSFDTKGRRIRRICDSDEENNTDFDYLDRNIRRKLEDNKLGDIEEESISKNNDNIMELEYNINDDTELDDNMESCKDYKNLGNNILKIKDSSLNTKSQVYEDLNINEEEELAKELLGTVAAQSSQLFRDYIEAILQFGRNFSFPSWLQLKNIKDMNGVRPLDSRYDPSTIWVPNSSSKMTKEEKVHFTPAMEQYWELKKEHFDKLLFFKMGKFYELFYIDACICQKHCDLRWTNGDAKPHVGFPETALHAYANKLVNLGYRVVVVEQMETPKELEERNRSASRGMKKEKAVKRSINEVLTNGTLVRPDMLNDMASILMTMYFEKKDVNELIYEVGIVCVDITTGKVELTSIEEKGEQFLNLRTIIYQVQPKEIAYLPGNIPLSVLKYLSSVIPKIQLTNFRDFVDSLLAISDIINTFEKLEKPIPEIVNHLCNISKPLCCALSGTFRYLSSILLCDRLIMTGSFYEYDHSSSKYLLLNVGALKDLELLQSQQGDEKNSLFGFLKHTITPGGSRLLKKWITYPLIDVERINERLDSISWFISNSDKIYEFREELRNIDNSLNNSSSNSRNLKKKYTQNLDLERLINRITSGILQNKRGAVYFTNVIQKRIDEFVNSMYLFDSILKCIIDIFGDKELRSTMPKLILALTGLNNDLSNGFLDNIFQTTERLRSLVIRDVNGKDWIPVPGKCQEYDDILNSINETKECLDNELKRISIKMNTTSLVYINNKYRYEVECPDSIPKSRYPESAEITSSKKGYIRFHTEEIKQLLYELEYKEEQLQKSLFPYLQLMSKEFYNDLTSFMAISDSVSQLDVLMSLAIVSMDTTEGPFCRPNFVSKSQGNNLPMLELKDSRHPVVAKLKSNYIPNDVSINTISNPAPCCLVTGPNMGGKSTILRQTCIVVIMAHIGCYVPASACNLTIVDKIFTRIGAYDSIIEGKSTFLIELEETAEILNHSTEDSLVIIDELGRGTSTFDGTSISIATLEYISRKIKCRCLFSTHLHLLCDEFSNDKQVLPFHMDLSLNDKTKSITFLYKFIPGICPKSYGMNVAQLAGIPQEIIDSSVSLANDVEYSTLILKNIAEIRKLIQDLLNQDDYSKIYDFFKNKKELINKYIESLPDSKI